VYVIAAEFFLRTVSPRTPEGVAKLPAVIAQLAAVRQIISP